MTGRRDHPRCVIAKERERLTRSRAKASAITFAELEYGVSVSGDPDREQANLDDLAEMIPVVPFDIEAARIYGPVRKATGERKQDHLDKLIAAHAMTLDVALVTNNTRDFLAYSGLNVENWLESQ